MKFMWTCTTSAKKFIANFEILGGQVVLLTGMISSFFTYFSHIAMAMGAILNLRESQNSTTTHTGKYSINTDSCTCSLPE